MPSVLIFNDITKVCAVICYIQLTSKQTLYQSYNVPKRSRIQDY